MQRISQSRHTAINAAEYPGTRQLCSECGEPTDRCEEDEICVWDEEEEEYIGPMCLDCYQSFKQEESA